VVEDGHLRGLIQRERVARHKRCALVTADFIDESLQRFGLAWSDVDVVAIATCQSWPYLFVEQERFRFDYDLNALARFPFKPEIRQYATAALNQPLARKRLADVVPRIHGGAYSEYLVDDVAGLDHERDALWCFEWPYYLDWWHKPHDQQSLGNWCARIPKLKEMHQGYMPIRVTLDGVSKPGLLVPHHLAHAAYAFYQSDADRAAVHTLDNGDVFRHDLGYVGGIYAYGEGNRLVTIGPNYNIHGHLYQRTAERLKLGHGSGAGKLMGLAPYGRARFADQAMVGNAYEVFGESYAHGTKTSLYTVLEPMHRRMQELLPGLYDDPDAWIDGVDPDARGSNDLRRAGVDLAASAQWIFEQSSLLAARSLSVGLARAGFSVPTLCLGGGGALNCPANTLVHDHGAFRDVLIAPACDDSGLPVGAAQAVVHDVFDVARESQGHGGSASAYRGLAYTRSDLDRALAAHGEDLVAEDRVDAAADAGRAVAAGAIVGWFEGRSEIGPRALGHRSLLADPRPAANWRRVNELKRREVWRPFAPAVLKERAGDWFRGGPSNSPHMLFTAQVRNDRLPAITHVDGSARVQTVADDTGQFRRVVEAFDAETGVPVVLNTSFNGPGEPIVETPEDALRFLATTEVDAVYVDGVKVTRRGG
jgi:carbamoyltransferase